MRQTTKLFVIAVILLIGLIAILTIDARGIESRAYINSLPDMPVQADVSYPLTYDERNLIERVVSAEARGESLEGQMAVAQVILDRAECWGMSISDVLLAEGQFASPFDGDVSALTKEAVIRIFDLREVIFAEPVTHFASNDPYWADDKVCRGMIGPHKFYY